jgi:putative hydrolase of the HAD superfamily
MRMPEFDAVVFDYGNTLITFEYPTEELLALMDGFRARIGHASGRQAPSAQELMDSILLPLERRLGTFGEEEVVYIDIYRQAWHRARLKLPDDLLLEMLDAEQRVWDRKITIIEGAIDTLARLKNRGLKLGLCSNASFPADMMRRQVEAKGVAGLMDAIVFSSAIGKRKPSPAIYAAVLSELGVNAGRTLFVGDRVREDYEGPIAFGMRAAICTAHALAPVPGGVRTIGSLHEIDGLL